MCHVDSATSDNSTLSMGEMKDLNQISLFLNTLTVSKQGSVTKPAPHQAGADLDLSRVQILKLPPCFDTPPRDRGRLVE